MDSARSTMIVLAAVAAITVAHRVSKRHYARQSTEADRLAARAGRLAEQQDELRHGQKELKRGLSQLLEMGDRFMDDHDNHMRAVAGAYEAIAPRPDQVGQARRLRQARGRMA